MEEESMNPWLSNVTEAMSNMTWTDFISIPTTFPDSENQKDVDDDVEYTPYSERPETYIVPVVFAIIFIVGVLGNGTLVVIFLRHRAMRNVPNT